MKTLVYFMKHIFTLINLTVWCVIAANGILGLLFFQNVRRNVVTINSNILTPQLPNFPVNKDTFFLEKRSKESYCDYFVEFCKCIVFEPHYFTERKYPMGHSLS